MDINITVHETLLIKRTLSLIRGHLRREFESGVCPQVPSDRFLTPESRISDKNWSEALKNTMGEYWLAGGGKYMPMYRFKEFIVFLVVSEHYSPQEITGEAMFRGLYLYKKNNGTLAVAGW